MVTTRRPAVLLKHVVLLEVPLIAEITEQPFWFWLWLRLRLRLRLRLWLCLWLWLWTWRWLWPLLWLLLWLWLEVWTFVHVVMVDRDVAVANQTSGLESLKLEIANIMHGSFGRGVFLRTMTSIRTGRIVDVGNVHRGSTRLR